MRLRQPGRIKPAPDFQRMASFRLDKIRFLSLVYHINTGPQPAKKMCCVVLNDQRARDEVDLIIHDSSMQL